MAYPKIKIRALQAFIAVYEEQSFSRAAERENTTQSGMSTQVKSLELILDRTGDFSFMQSVVCFDCRIILEPSLPESLLLP